MLVGLVAETELLETMAIRRFIRSIPVWDKEKQLETARKAKTCLAVRRFTTPDGQRTVYTMTTGITHGYRAFATVFLVVSHQS